jgi:hypothetical protein
MNKAPVAFISDREVSNGHLGVALFEAFLRDEAIEVREVREKVLRLGQMAQLLVKGLDRYDAEIDFMTQRLEDGCEDMLCDADLKEALKSISIVCGRLK